MPVCIGVYGGPLDGLRIKPDDVRDCNLLKDQSGFIVLPIVYVDGASGGASCWTQTRDGYQMIHGYATYYVEGGVLRFAAWSKVFDPGAKK